MDQKRSQVAGEERISGRWAALFLVWIVAAVATLGSLFFSEVVGVPVCVLCWYQRVALYPLAVMLPLGLFPYDPNVIRYAGALVGVGWLVALFHLLLIMGVVPKTVQPCVQGIPCTETYVALWGFLTIPLMSFLTFTFLGGVLFYVKRIDVS